MQEVFLKILKRKRLSVCVTSNQNQHAYLSKRLHLLFKNIASTHSRFTDSVPPVQLSTQQEAVAPQPKKDFYVIPGNANFVVESFSAPCYNHCDSVTLQVASRLTSKTDLENAAQTL